MRQTTPLQWIIDFVTFCTFLSETQSSLVQRYDLNMNMLHAVQHDTHLSYLCRHTTNQHIIMGAVQIWIGTAWTTWENCFSAITGHVIKQDGSSPSSKPHMTNEWSEHKNSCVAKINKINAFKIKVAIASSNLLYFSHVQRAVHKNKSCTITNFSF